MPIGSMLLAACGTLLLLALLNPAGADSRGYRISGPLGFAMIGLTVLRVTDWL